MGPASDSTGSPDIATLVTRAQEGDGASTQTLFAWCLDRLRPFVAARLGPGLRAHESVSDIVQSAAGEAVVSLGRYRPSGPGFLPWLLRIAERKVIERIRYWNADKRAGARAAQGEDGETPLVDRVPSPGTSPSSRAEKGETRVMMAEALNALRSEDRQALILRFYSGLSFPECSAALGCSEDAARMRVNRALAALRERLQPGSTASG